MSREGVGGVGGSGAGSELSAAEADIIRLRLAIESLLILFIILEVMWLASDYSKNMIS